MTIHVSPEELARRSAVVLAALTADAWMRPIQIANAAGLPFGMTKGTLKRLLAVGAVRKREYEIRVMRGATRKRITTKPIVEYQLVPPATWPTMWLASAPPPILGARAVKGRCGCSG